MRMHPQSGGPVVTTTAILPQNATFPNPSGFTFLVDWDNNRDSVPVDLDLQIKTPSARQGFPASNVPGERQPTFNAGANCDSAFSIWDDGLAASGGDGNPLGVLKLEMANFGSERTLYADLKGGRWSLGSYGRVRASFSFWGAGGGYVFPIEILASVVPASPRSPHLQFTAAKNVVSGDSAIINAPPGAFAFDFFTSSGSGVGPIVNAQVLTNNATFSRDFSSSAYAPPYKATCSQGALISLGVTGGVGTMRLVTMFDVA